MIRFFSTCALLLLGLAPAAAQVAEITPKGALVEHYGSKARISSGEQVAGIVVGLLMSGPKATARPALFARVPAAWRGADMCVRVVSSDGRYEAVQAYAIGAAWRGGVARLPFKSDRHEELLKELESADIAVAVRRGACGEDSAEYAPAGWNEDIPADTDGARLLVNSARADEVYLVVGDADISCVPSQSSNRTAFDFICDLPGAILFGGEALSVEVNRVRRGSFDAAVAVVIPPSGVTP